MKIDFFKNIGSGVAYEDAAHVHSFLLEEFLFYEKLRSQRSIFYGKVWVFFLFCIPALLGFYFSQTSETDTIYYLILGTLIGSFSLLVGCFGFFAQDCTYVQIMMEISTKGKKIEEEYSSLIPSTIFHSVEKGLSLSRTLIARFAAPFLVLIELIILSFVLASKVGLWFAFLISVFAVALLFFAFFFFKAVFCKYRNIHSMTT